MKKNKIKKYVEKFNRNDNEIYIQDIPNKYAEEWMINEIPYFESDNLVLEETYYFRWWVFRKHIKTTLEGKIITEFLPDVYWSGKYNSINCAVGHHISEARWLRNNKSIIHDYVNFWFKGSGDITSYSSWIVDAVYQYCLITGDEEFGVELIPEFLKYYIGVEHTNLTKYGLFWSYDDRDAMEMSISGSGLRPTLNSYMYANAIAISEFARISKNSEIAEKYQKKAEELKKNIRKFMWDSDEKFFKVIPQESKETEIATFEFKRLPPIRNVKESVGYIPWSFGIADRKNDDGWRYLQHKDGFFGEYGPTTAERKHPFFNKMNNNHECLWNGPSWPFATTQIMNSMIEALNQNCVTISKSDFNRQLIIYAKSSYKLNKYGEKINWIDENIEPDTGERLSRKYLKNWGWPKSKGGYERGKDYNHSTFCDLIIRGFCGVNLQRNKLIINPLINYKENDYFCLENVLIRNKKVSVFFDKHGTRYNMGKGIVVIIDGVKYLNSTTKRIEINV